MVQDRLPPPLKETPNSRGRSERIPEYRSGGREPYVFRVERIEDLRSLHIGVHAELMQRSLLRDEELLYLLYSPIYQEKKGPFGLQGTPSSHAVAVTSDRFVISENQHRNGTAPTVQSIPFRQVLYVQLGTALLLGWFSIEFVADDKPSCATLFFPATTGMKHFGIVVREYRSMSGRAYNQLPADATEWPEIWLRTPQTLIDHLEPVIVTGELPFNLLRSSERWITRKMRWKSIPACLSTTGILASTNFGFIYATEDKPTRPDVYSFGVNVSCIPANRVKSAQVVQKRIYGSHLFVFKQEITQEGVTVEFDIPFDDNCLMDAETLVLFSNQRLARRR